MIKIIQFFRLIFESMFYTLLLLLVVVSIIYSVHTLHESGSEIHAKSYCESNEGKSMKIKKIIEVENEDAKVQMEDDSIQSYTVKHYIAGGKGGGSTLRFVNIEVGNVICVKN